tara:strand:- start:11833 stop:13344 length:1512 start_codon:yes stop_codon:yes gene_type:complete
MLNKIRDKRIRLFIYIIFISSLISLALELLSLEIILLVTLITLIKKKDINFKRIISRIYYITKININKTIDYSRKYKAVKNNIKSIKTLSKEFEDDIKTKIIKEEVLKIEKELEKGDLNIIVFGAVSSGKTSIVRLLLNQIVGDVSPTIGTTKAITKYPLVNNNFSRNINIIDTPGLYDDNEKSFYRERISKSKVTRSELILFTIDADIREKESNQIFNLYNIGKRILIVLNKSDLRTEDENKLLIKKLNHKFKSFIKEQDIVLISASPNSSMNYLGQSIKGKPIIDNLLSRIIEVLNIEGEELLADNILYQCHELGTISKSLISKQRYAKVNKIIKKYAVITSGICFINPLPLIDLIGVSLINYQMVKDIAKIYLVTLNTEQAKNLASILIKTIAGLGLSKASYSLVKTLLSLSGPSLLISNFIDSTVSAIIIKVAGESLNIYFKQGQNWGDGGISEVIQKQYKLNSRGINIKEFIDDIVDSLIKRDNNKKLLMPQDQNYQV